jgi:GntR family transcriptional regulator
MPSVMPIPKYHQVYLVLKEHLVEGDVGTKLPSETTLMKRFDVGRVTIRRALELLVNEGLISRRAGRGTLSTVGQTSTTSPFKDKRKQNRSGLLENLVTISLGTKIEVIEVNTLAASPQVSQALQINQGEPVQKAVRVRHTDNGPLSHITTYIPAAWSDQFDQTALANEPILVLLEKTGLKIGRAEQHISACLADATVAPLLGIAVGSALLSVRRLVFDDKDRPMQWLHGLYRPDRYDYELKLSPAGDVDARVWVNNEITARFD